MFLLVLLCLTSFCFFQIQVSPAVVAKELSVSDTDISEVSWTDNGTFNLSEGNTPQTDTSDGMCFFPVFQGFGRAYVQCPISTQQQAW